MGTFAGINGHLNLFVNPNNCNFTLIKPFSVQWIKLCYAGGALWVMAAHSRSC